MIRTIFLFFLFVQLGCSSMKYNKTVDYVDIPRFMGNWYVLTGRTSFLEKGAHNSLEVYTWNQEKERIDIGFTFRADSFDGKEKSIPQTAWIENKKTNAHWKVRPFWPLKFDYLVVALGKDYDWTAIGVPDGGYLWIMARTPQVSEEKMQEILSEIRKTGYPLNDLVAVPQRWEK